jgi:Putative peptidoglycan binding domain/L,D-transpeptidase catalytic domain
MTLTLAAGCVADQPPTPGTPSPAVPSPSAPASAPSAAPAPTATPTPTPTKPAKLRIGDEGEEVTALQERLTGLGYWVGKPDGEFGSTTRQAVFALQKAAGLARDGVVGAATRKALANGVRPKARSDKGHVIEINLRRQLLLIVDDGTIEAILNTSTGSNQHYEYQGETYLAHTPTGHYAAYRQIDGWRNGPLGPLWRPKYFNGGIAVHGAPSVPPYPASHGCARVSIAAMNWIWSTGKMPLGTKVWVY